MLVLVLLLASVHWEFWEGDSDTHTRSAHGEKEALLAEC